ncbi:hypothetical protein VCRA2119O147_1630006 [Vibrio crassostreae]|uniref:Uncharacterized protein n=1 Tax=Vibrio crassostreae TaxID=246167 RepID=A0A822MRZ1_9VIBR|nr:hypothetical protein VCRA2119O381_1490005 [Vibrio crassostreae]CAK2091545.1 hypothetical protein VCRA2116O31_470003 [Vibrio crassostreae]CAK2103826.1 hypothetical protein VCRA2116O26_480003 [Vibrio crassostreae]CAK2117515.1 hypothetical protein VCRA2117O38_460003 [Vibrio crassostreae]CAK2118269.1 hypothetical protein VCRA2113O22_480005 [Vibrio crassostreae]
MDTGTLLKICLSYTNPAMKIAGFVYERQMGLWGAYVTLSLPLQLAKGRHRVKQLVQV